MVSKRLSSACERIIGAWGPPLVPYKRCASASFHPWRRFITEGGAQSTDPYIRTRIYGAVYIGRRPPRWRRHGEPRCPRLESRSRHAIEAPPVFFVCVTCEPLMFSLISPLTGRGSQANCEWVQGGMEDQHAKFKHVHEAYISGLY